MTPLQLKTLRRGMGWSQLKLAHLAHWSRTKVQCHENGRRDISLNDITVYRDIFKRRVK